MRFVADQDVWQVTISFLRALGHEVQRVADVGLAQASDEQVLGYAQGEGRILVTRDKGFGGLVFAGRRAHSGVILLRMSPEDVQLVHQELERCLGEHSAEELGRCFVVVEAGRHRLRRAP